MHTAGYDPFSPHVAVFPAAPVQVELPVQVPAAIAAPSKPAAAPSKPARKPAAKKAARKPVGGSAKPRFRQVPAQSFPPVPDDLSVALGALDEIRGER